MIKNSKKIKEYSTDGKVRHFSTEKDINIKLGEIIGKNIKGKSWYNKKEYSNIYFWAKWKNSPNN